MSTTAIGSIAFCGEALGYAISYTCSGLACTVIQDLPVVSCTEDGDEMTCTNGVTCPDGSSVANWRIDYTESAVFLESIMDMGDCGSFKITSNGLPAGTLYEVLVADNDKCGLPNSGPGGEPSSSSTKVFPNATSSAPPGTTGPNTSVISSSSKPVLLGPSYSDTAAVTVTETLPITTCLTAINGDEKTLCVCSELPSAYTPCDTASSEDAVETYHCPHPTKCTVLHTSPGGTEETPASAPGAGPEDSTGGMVPIAPTPSFVQSSSGNARSPMGIVFDIMALLLVQSSGDVVGTDAYALHSEGDSDDIALLKARQSLLVKGVKELMDALGSFAAGKLAPSNPNEPTCPRDLASEITNGVCSYVTGKLAAETSLLGLAQVAALTQVCVSVVFSGMMLAPFGVFLGTFAASLLCNAIVNELFPLHTDVKNVASNAMCSVLEGGIRGCNDLSNSDEHCGCCGNKCPAGSTCQNGACTANTCQGSTCGGFTRCGPGGPCICVTATEGFGFCHDGGTLCSGLSDCSSSDDCSPGSICAFQTCCQRNVCASATFCGGGSILGKRWLENGTEGAGMELLKLAM